MKLKSMYSDEEIYSNASVEICLTYNRNDFYIHKYKKVSTMESVEFSSTI